MGKPTILQITDVTYLSHHFESMKSSPLHRDEAAQASRSNPSHSGRHTGPAEDGLHVLGIEGAPQRCDRRRRLAARGCPPVQGPQRYQRRLAAAAAAGALLCAFSTSRLMCPHPLRRRTSTAERHTIPAAVRGSTASKEAFVPRPPSRAGCMCDRKTFPSKFLGPSEWGGSADPYAGQGSSQTAREG